MSNESGEGRTGIDPDQRGTEPQDKFPSRLSQWLALSVGERKMEPTHNFLVAFSQLLLSFDILFLLWR